MSESYEVNEWIENRFYKRECVNIVPTSRDSNKCGCGRYLANHSFFENEYDSTDNALLRWNIAKCTSLYPTDAFGTLSFQGIHSLNKSQYIRLDFGTEPQDIWHLLVDAWGFEPPKLIVSVDGGNTNFEIQQTLSKALRKGLLNAAKTTNAWIITSGVRAGAVKHVANALSENFSARKLKFTVIGILPWASLKRSDDLINLGRTLPYYPQSVSDKSRYVTLCEGHTCFLLVDNGAVGRPGAELFLRRRFEEFLKQKPMGKSSRLMPIVNLVLSGGRQTVQSVLSNVSGKPPLPIVVCNGTGRAADVICLMYKLLQDEKDLDDNCKRQMIRMIEDTFAANEEEAMKLYKTIILIAKKRNLINIFSCNVDSDHEEDLDCIILNALLKDHNFQPVEQLSLLLTWNREDVAKEIFEKGHDWPVGSLDMAMMHALAYDRVGFVKLLLANGIEMDKFLTVFRLEDLYNTLRRQTIVQKEIDDRIIRKGQTYKSVIHFNHPFNDLFIWAVLTKRHDMAMCMWAQGDEPLAKALVGYRLNKMLAKEAEDDYFKVEICEQLRMNAKAFKSLACELLDECYRTDDDLTFQLLTYELKYWSKKSNITLAALANHKRLLAHPSCQMLMADLWLGGLRIRKNAGLKVFMSVICPPMIFLLPFKTQEQLLYQPQTEEEFFENRPELNDEDSDSSADSDSDSADDERRHSFDIENVGGSLNNVIDAHGKRSEASTSGGRTRKFSRSLPMSVSSVGLTAKYDHQTNVWSSKSSETMTSQIYLNNDSLSLPPKRQRTGAKFSSISVLEPRELDELNTLASLSSNVAKKKSCECSTASCKCSLNKNRDRLRSVFSLGNIFDSAEQKENISLQQQRFSLVKNHELTIKKKLEEFYRAPIACFWSFVIGYVFFLGTYTYTVLVATTSDINWPEYYVIAFITTFAIDQIRRVLLQEPKSLDSKLNVYCQRMWDLLSCISCIVFFVALFLRVSQETGTRMMGRILYCCNIPFWYVRSMHLLTVSSQLGPYIFMFGKMVIKMCILATILFVLLMSFGVVRQSILYPYQENWTWSLLQGVVYKPYFMLYGELYADHIDDCGDNNGEDCVPGFWISIVFMTIYLLLSIIVFVNMMIAAFKYKANNTENSANHVFIDLQSKTHLIWQMQRYDQVMEYEQQPFFPPPFIIIADVYLLCKYLYRRVLKRNKVYRFEHSLRLYLSSNELDKLHDFEMICLKELSIKKENVNPDSFEEQLKQMKEKIEKLTEKIDDRYDQWTKDQLSLLLLNDKCSRAENSVASLDMPQTPSKVSPDGSQVPSEMEVVSKPLPILSRKRTGSLQETYESLDSKPCNSGKVIKNVTWASYEEDNEEKCQQVAPLSPIGVTANRLTKSMD